MQINARFMVFGVPVNLQNHVLELDEGSRIIDLLAAAEPSIGLYRNVKSLETASYVINEQFIANPLYFELHDGDNVLVMMPMGGG